MGAPRALPPAPCVTVGKSPEPQGLGFLLWKVSELEQRSPGPADVMYARGWPLGAGRTTLVPAAPGGLVRRLEGGQAEQAHLKGLSLQDTVQARTPQAHVSHYPREVKGKDQSGEEEKVPAEAGTPPRKSD